ncbi:heme-binding protein [Streptomyces sp. NPDC016626]|uniref:heme-binding protein n=1 Tax=Streptomyces sp. NPDC016626 TaxID=3364968 RepID=UPI0036FDE83C
MHGPPIPRCPSPGWPPPPPLRRGERAHPPRPPRTTRTARHRTTPKGRSRTDAPFLPTEAAPGEAWTAASLPAAAHTGNGHLADPRIAPPAGRPRPGRAMAVGGGRPVGGGCRRAGSPGISGGSHAQDRRTAGEALAAPGASRPAH